MTSSESIPPVSPLDPTPLLLSPDLASEEVSRLLSPYGFKNWEKADANLQLMAGDPRSRKKLVPILQNLLKSVSYTADPDQGLNEWERFLEAGGSRVQVFSFLAHIPHLIDLLSVLFGNSQAMAETLIRDPPLIYWLEDERILQSRPTKKRSHALLTESLRVVQTYERKLDILRRFHRREMLRIGARDLMRVATVQETYQSLSRLAEIVIQAAYLLVNAELQAKHGIPHHKNLKGLWQKTGFVILGMGKLGGGELNYSSDVDLVYVYDSSEGQTEATKNQLSLSNEAYFQNLARGLTQVLSASTSEGSMFRVDLRLRPEGTVGPLACSTGEAVAYYQTRGRTWERLAFLKARPIAGELSVGKNVLKKIRPFVIGEGAQPAHDIVEAVCSLRAQIHQKVKRKGDDDRNVKLSPGGIRDIEFIVQTLQLIHVGLEPKLFESQTLKSIKLLVEQQHLLPDQGEKLKTYYLYLRDIEHKLQMVHELQTHTLPLQDEEILKCAIRMGTPNQNSPANPSLFLSEYQIITSQVRDLFQEILL